MNSEQVKIVAVVPAAGTGSRINSDIPKQYLRIGDLTIIEHTLIKLLTHPKIDRIIVALSEDDQHFKTLPIDKHNKISTVLGGKTRADSVLAGLEMLDDNDWALVHDAARPCITHTDINKLIDTVLETQQGGILATRVSDTIKKADNSKPTKIESSLDRTYLWAAATPQLFKSKQLKSCLKQAIQNQITITDEASAIEYGGGQPLLIEGRRDNIKVTQPEDVALATFYLMDKS